MAKALGDSGAKPGEEDHGEAENDEASERGEDFDASGIIKAFDERLRVGSERNGRGNTVNEGGKHKTRPSEMVGGHTWNASCDTRETSGLHYHSRSERGLGCCQWESS